MAACCAAVRTYVLLVCTQYVKRCKAHVIAIHTVICHKYKLRSRGMVETNRNPIARLCARTENDYYWLSFTPAGENLETLGLGISIFGISENLEMYLFFYIPFWGFSVRFRLSEWDSQNWLNCVSLTLIAWELAALPWQCIQNNRLPGSMLVVTC